MTDTKDNTLGPLTKKDVPGLMRTPTFEDNLAAAQAQEDAAAAAARSAKAEATVKKGKI